FAVKECAADFQKPFATDPDGQAPIRERLGLDAEVGRAAVRTGNFARNQVGQIVQIKAVTQTGGPGKNSRTIIGLSESQIQIAADNGFGLPGQGDVRATQQKLERWKRWFAPIELLQIGFSYDKKGRSTDIRSRRFDPDDPFMKG